VGASSGTVSVGEPWPKKNAGMRLGEPGSAARRSCQAERVRGRSEDISGGWSYCASGVED